MSNELTPSNPDETQAKVQALLDARPPFKHALAESNLLPLVKTPLQVQMLHEYYTNATNWDENRAHQKLGTLKKKIHALEKLLGGGKELNENLGEFGIYARNNARGHTPLLEEVRMGPEQFLLARQITAFEPSAPLKKNETFRKADQERFNGLTEQLYNSLLKTGMNSETAHNQVELFAAMGRGDSADKGVSR